MSARPDAETLFRQLWACPGISVQEIADYYGVTRQAIHERAKRRGLPPRPFRSDAQIKDRALFRRMWLDGVTGTDIAAHFGVTLTAVRNLVRLMDLPRRKRGRGPGGWEGIPMSVWREQRYARALAVERRAA